MLCMLYSGKVELRLKEKGKRIPAQPKAPKKQFHQNNAAVPASMPAINIVLKRFELQPQAYLVQYHDPKLWSNGGDSDKSLKHYNIMCAKNNIRSNR